MTEREVRHRLAAIVSADVVGYTRLMESDEAGTHVRLKARYTTFMIGERGGRVVKLMGDGLLAEFPSVIDAVKWAVEIQAKVAELSAEEEQDRVQGGRQPRDVVEPMIGERGGRVVKLMGDGQSVCC